jgi:hypothetical protein
VVFVDSLTSTNIAVFTLSGGSCVNSIQVIVSTFVADLVARVEEDVLRRTLEAVTGVFAKLPHGLTTASRSVALGSQTVSRAERPVMKVKFRNGTWVAVKVRRPREKLLCPVPGCEGLAAPIFGMVCGEHRNVSKQKIARYRAYKKAARSAGVSMRVKQLCPVPGCAGLAAPIFGMVCGEHRDVEKWKIARYRAERRELRAAEISV